MLDLLPFVISGLGAGAVYALSGVGLVVLYRSSGVLNFAFGAIGAVSAFTAWSLLEWHDSLALAFAGAVAVAAAISLLYGLWIAPYLSERDQVVRSVGTLGLALVLMGLTEWYWGESPRRLVLPTDADAFELGQTRLTHTRALTLALAFALMSSIGLLLSKTRLGLQMRAMANERSRSRLLGIRVLRVDTIVWVLCGCLAGVCGVVMGNLVRMQATVLTFMVIPAFAAAIVGRLHSLPITVASGLSIGLIEALAILIPGFASYRSATPFLVALAAILLLRIDRNGT